jgi:hypothetical protein
MYDGLDLPDPGYGPDEPAPPQPGRNALHVRRFFVVLVVLLVVGYFVVQVVLSLARPR